MKNLKLAFAVLALICFTSSQAQVGGYFDKFRPAKQWSVGLGLGPTFYNGEADNLEPGFSFGGHVKYSISQSFGLKLSGNIGTLNGGRQNFRVSNNANGTVFEDGGNQNPAEDSYSFTNNFRDLNLVTVYTLGNISFLRPLRKLQMFAFFGVGAVWSDAKGSFGESSDAQAFYQEWGDDYLTPLDASGNAIDPATAQADPSLINDAEMVFNGRNFTIPYGLGIKRNFGNRLDLGLEWRLNWTRGDNLDAFSFPIWRNRNFDQYSQFQLQASFKLGNKDMDEHYDWLNPIETIYADMDSMKQITNDLQTLIEDADGDGVGDFFDQEENTDCDRVYANGVAMDSDKDGVNDCNDKELFSLCTEVDENGVALDSDGDGVPNCLDEEPNTAAGGLVDARGVGVDLAALAGGCCDCENVTLPTVIFDNNSSRISPASYGVLYAVAEKLKSCPGLKITATGYTTSKSGEQLAYKRANSIIDHLEANYGIERSRVSTDYTTGSDVEYSTRRIDLGQSK